MRPVPPLRGSPVRASACWVRRGRGGTATISAEWRAGRTVTRRTKSRLPTERRGFAYPPSGSTRRLRDGFAGQVLVLTLRFGLPSSRSGGQPHQLLGPAACEAEQFYHHFNLLLENWPPPLLAAPNPRVLPPLPPTGLHLRFPHGAPVLPPSSTPALFSSLSLAVEGWQAAQSSIEIMHARSVKTREYPATRSCCTPSPVC